MYLQQILHILTSYIPDKFGVDNAGALGPCSVGAANGDIGTKIGTHAFTSNSRTVSAVWYIA